MNTSIKTVQEKILIDQKMNELGTSFKIWMSKQSPVYKKRIESIALDVLPLRLSRLHPVLRLLEMEIILRNCDISYRHDPDYLSWSSFYQINIDDPDHSSGYFYIKLDQDLVNGMAKDRVMAKLLSMADSKLKKYH